MLKDWFDAIPLPGVFLVTLLIVLAALEGGYRMGLYRGIPHDDEKEAPIGAMAGTSLGLLAFLLAFTFGVAAQRFDARKQLVVDEANSIGTTWLRAGMLAEPHRANVRSMLREYVEVRLRASASGSIEPAIERSEALHGRLWSEAEAVGAAAPTSIMAGLFVESLNETIDLHSKRVAAVRSRVPGVVWLALYGMAVVALAGMGYHAALARSSRSIAVLSVALTFSAVLWLVADLDRPGQGSLVVSQKPLEDLLKSFH